MDDDFGVGHEQAVDDEPDQPEPVKPGGETDGVEEELLRPRKMVPKGLQLDSIICNFNKKFVIILCRWRTNWGKPEDRLR